MASRNPSFDPGPWYKNPIWIGLLLFLLIATILLLYGWHSQPSGEALAWHGGP